MTHFPKVSIIVPVYNAEKFLRPCVDSLISQTLQDIEVILVNDGSTDGSGALCDNYAAADNRVRVIHSPNKGVSNARNLGIEMARGEYIMFVDSDDWVDKNSCAEAWQMAHEGKIDILFWSCIKVFPEKSVKDMFLEQTAELITTARIADLRMRCIGLFDADLRHPTKTDAYTSPWAKLFRRQMVIDSQIRFIERKKLGMEDVFFNIEMFQRAERVAYLPKHYYFYMQVNSVSLSRADTSSLLDKFKVLFAKIREIPQVNADPRFAEVYRNRLAMSIINLSLSVTNPQKGLGFAGQRREIRKILNDAEIRQGLQQLPLGRLPGAWKLFFGFAKARAVVPFLLMMLLIRRLR